MANWQSSQTSTNLFEDIINDHELLVTGLTRLYDILVKRRCAIFGHVAGLEGDIPANTWCSAATPIPPWVAFQVTSGDVDLIDPATYDSTKFVWTARLASVV